ncbi:rhomboid family intramembrane serine protease [Flavobacterium sp. SM2513]|uniref:rhomboid family intramembrane serine protease n=1 Tax=Flavobacterium sp. SM2513 TaxID=3424766 RepID=UPI003D7FF390
MMNITPMVKQLLIINIIFYIGSQILGSTAYDLFSLYFFENDKFQIWQPLTHMFMHAQMPNIMHILFNMFALYSFGSALETFWGGKKFLFFYISCGLGAALLHLGVNYYEFHSGLDVLVDAGFSKTDIFSLLNERQIDTRWAEVIGSSGVDKFASSFVVPAVGASGAVYGLLVAFAYMFPNAQLGLMFIPIPIKAKYFVPVILLIDLVLGFKGDAIFSGGSGIAHFAHLGGALTGFLMMYYWKKTQFNNNRWN